MVIGELENRCNAVPMAFGQAYCIRHRLPDQIGSKEIVSEMADIKPVTQGFSTTPELHVAAPTATIWRNGKMIQTKNFALNWNPPAA